MTCAQATSGGTSGGKLISCKVKQNSQPVRNSCASGLKSRHWFSRHWHCTTAPIALLIIPIDQRISEYSPKLLVYASHCYLAWSHSFDRPLHSIRGAFQQVVDSVLRRGREHKILPLLFDAVEVCLPKFLPAAISIFCHHLTLLHRYYLSLVVTLNSSPELQVFILDYQ